MIVNKKIRNMKYSLYPLQKINIKIKWDYDEFFFQRWHKEAYTSLLKNSDRTDNPEEADF